MEESMEKVMGCDLAQKIGRDGKFNTAENNAAYIKHVEGIGFYSTLIAPKYFYGNRYVLKKASEKNALFLNVVGPEESLFLDKVTALLNDNSNAITNVLEAVESVFHKLRRTTQARVVNTVDYSKVLKR